MPAKIPELTPAKARALNKRAEDKTAFFAEHWSEFQERYLKQFVAVHDGTVIAHDSDLRNIPTRVRSQGLDIRDVWLEYIPDPDESLIL